MGVEWNGNGDGVEYLSGGSVETSTGGASGYFRWDGTDGNIDGGEDLFWNGAMLTWNGGNVEVGYIGNIELGLVGG